ncbi:histidine kinase [Desulfosporosinus sp. HMP52]|uniref:sensor histidine kinase n=1 Tax=Desulfosporosinus sp. HMP52 TaxID=1487923 RepID=UPI00051FD7FB|nr:HAMP domain-containing sensor histidine kinase [Desulfosporosinus sp. HMP52]KGK86491.1 histidine kinase [Desulfosporosinus sp. HMP52]
MTEVTYTETQFAPAKRLLDGEIKIQAEQIINQNLVPDLFKLIPSVILVLNKERQIIYSNDVLLETIGISAKSKFLGLRPGELLNCVHSNTMQGGCGTSENCSVCGSIQAILESQMTKAPVAKECLLTANTEHGEECLELSIYAAPIKYDFTLFIVRDISEEKKRQMYERVFFHDLINSSGAARGLISLIKEITDINEARELSTYAFEAIEQVLEEINSQKSLKNAENGTLNLNLSEFRVKELVERLAELYQKNNIVTCPIEVKCDIDVMVYSDAVLVRRVLNNMLKNAVESSHMDTVTVEGIKKDGYVEFKVNNRQYIPKDIQLQMFKRTFSTKGDGRGLGTYSMKLLGEKYLGGYVKFVSTEETGTTFVFGLPIQKVQNQAVSYFN